MFLALNTQWNIGQGRVTGLRYEVIPAVMELQGIRKKARAGIFRDLRIMEEEALKIFNR